MGARIIAISRRDFTEALTTGDVWLKLPTDVTIVDVRVNFDTECFELRCTSAEWSEVPEGCRIPVHMFDLMLRRLEEARGIV